jgi:EAL domain-containing protein (putative c-di-GMP-specific phosphodiesterase class I)
MNVADYQVLCDQCRTALGGARIHALSLHDHRGEVLYLSGGLLGPDEHGMVGDAVTIFSALGAPQTFSGDLGGGRTAIALAAHRSERDFCGLILIIVDAKRLDPQSDILRSRPVRELLTHFAESLDPPPLVARPAESPTVRLKRLALSPAAPIAPEVRSLKDVLRRMPIELYVQRLMPITSQSIPAHYEVLLRCKSEGAAAEAPQDLIKAAVEHGLGSVIDRRVLIFLTQWLKRHRPVVPGDGVIFSVNVTATTLHDAQFGRFLEHVLRTCALPTALIAIELDSAQCLQYRGAANSLCARLEQLGCPAVLDNFEPYNRGLDLLRLPGVRLLKLNPRITQSMRSDARARATVAEVVQASRVLGLHTAVKYSSPGVDAEWLKALGIDFIQSDRATKPRPLDTLAGRSRGTGEQPASAAGD